MKAEFTQKPQLFSTLLLPNSNIEVVIRDGIEEARRTQHNGEEPREVTYWTADEYVTVVPYRENIEQEIREHFSVWAHTAKESACEKAKKSKLTEVSNVCTSTIYSGVDIVITDNVEHFSLTEKDQINISQAAAAVSTGLPGFPYHADGNICRMFTAAEIATLAEAATAFVLYHTTLCNHLNIWIRRCESDTEVSGIYYGAPLPEDLAESFSAIIGGSE